MVTEFTPLQSLSGGVLIGLAAVFLMASLGRIMGATGILRGAILPESVNAFGWRAVMLLGMISAPVLLRLISGEEAPLQVPVTPVMLVLGGVLVGMGTSWGGGCTSGHGVCGIARLSKRSIVATLTFMATAMITVYLIRHAFGG